MLRAIIKQSCFFLSRQPRQQQSFYKQLKTITTGDNYIEKETNEDVILTCKVLRLTYLTITCLINSLNSQFPLDLAVTSEIADKGESIHPVNKLIVIKL